MVYVAGIDAHTSYLVVAIVSREGVLQERRRVPVAEPALLLRMLGKHTPIEVVVETSSAWPWLRDLLIPAGAGFVLAHAKRLRVIAESTYKSDDIDAELLARMHLAGLIPRVHAKDQEQREWGTLIRHRFALVSKRTALINQVHGQLHQVGLRIGRGRLLTRAGRTWLRQEAWPRLSLEQRRLIRTHLKLVQALRPLIRSLDKRLQDVTRTIPAALLLQTVPGIGPYRSLTILAEAWPIDRFATSSKLVAYAGLAPTTRASGGRVKHGPIPQGANRRLRSAFVQAVITHATTQPDSWLSAHYRNQKQRLGWQVARLATARKLCRCAHAMLRTGEAWRIDVPSSDRGELQGSHAAAPASSLIN